MSKFNVNKSLQLCSKFFVLFCLFHVCYEFTLSALFKSGKLYTNDSLLILYALSSSTITIWFLYIMIYYVYAKSHNNVSVFGVVVIILCSNYFIKKYPVCSFVTTTLTITTVNTSLQNGLLNVHPFIIYYIYGTILIVWILLYTKDIFLQHAGSRTYDFNITLIVLIGTLLGAVWASQELNWGGFWSWDPVELVSVVVLFFFIRILHDRSYFTINRFCSVVVSTFAIIYLVIRLGLITSIHSFIRVNSTPIYTQLIVCLIAVIWVMWLIRHKSIAKYIYMRYNTSVHKHIIILLVLVVYLFLVLLLINSILYITPFLYVRPATAYIWIVFSTTIIFSQCSHFWSANAVISVLLLLYCVFYKINIAALIVIYLFLNISIILYKNLHLIAFLIYVLFSFFFVSLTIYTMKSGYYRYNHIYLNTASIEVVNHASYEIFFILKKSLIVAKFKNILYHTTGFGILSNGFTGLYMFTTNFRLSFLFGLEIIYTTVYYLFFVMVFSFKNYYKGINRELCTY